MVQKTRRLSQILDSDEIYILFGGPSLKGFNFNLLDGLPTLACNKSAEVYNADCVISIDPTYINTRRDFLARYNGRVAIAHRGTDIGGTKPNRGVIDYIDPDYIYRHDKSNPHLMSEDPDVLYGTNTGHAAINFSVLQGFTTIHALGLDLSVVGHWHGGYTHSRQCSHLLYNWARYIDGCKNYLESIGVRLINYNINSGVTEYEYRDYSELRKPLSKKKERVLELA